MSDEKETTAAEEREMVVVFQGDLYNCKERQDLLAENEIESEILSSDIDLSSDGVPPIMQLAVYKEDLEDVAELFAAEWEESLYAEGFNDEQIEQIEQSVVDLSQDTIICPGCQSEISEVTEDGECIECGLFLGLPEESDDEEHDDDDEDAQ